ncbi:ESX secretion-associated protein EspG [Nocardia sp. CNY236]|uniref:ESX secretion-associated protein EspG n=1 Tax=Nocardia sp. CNY236 TaxID=1169152 RepID=UPI000413B1C6|nr:ESX secretion-associated protein EspG [Nocardia sp. CNY236]
MKTRKRFAFTADEFSWVWAETGLPYPEPVSIRETPTTPTEYAIQRTRIADTYPHHGDPDLSGPLRVLANPDVRILATGIDHLTNHRIRCQAAAIGELGVILHQSPGRTPEFGGDIRIVVTRRSHLARYVAATLPEAAPGSAGPMTEYTARVRGDAEPITRMVALDGRIPEDQRIRTLLRAPRTAEGHLCIEQFLHDRRPPRPVYLNWITVDPAHHEGGRYLIDVSYDTTVTPATDDIIAAEITCRAELADLA